MTVQDFQKPALWLGIETLSLRRLLLLIGGFAVAAVVYWQIYETRFYRAAIPAQIGLTFSFATTGSNVSLWDGGLFAQEACGGAIFNLSDTAAIAISQRGLDFLRDARQGRGYTDNAQSAFHYYSYEPWQSTPLASQWTLYGPWLGLNCMDLGNGVLRSVLNAAQNAGSFYTTGQSKMLLVVPSLKIAVYTYTR
jgi:hypothetical protein